MMTKMISVIKNYLFNLKLLPKKPQLILRIIKNYFRILVLRKPCLRVVTLAMNYACQLSCQHCSADDFMQKEKSAKKIPLSRIPGILKEAEACGAINIHFTGGDPLLNKDLYKMAAMVNTKRNILSLVTNGLLLKKESENLKKAKFDLVIVSLDSSNSEIHDTIRGAQGAYRKAWEGIEAALQAGLKVMVAMVVTTENLLNGDVEEMIKLCRTKKLILQLLPAR